MPGPPGIRAAVFPASRLRFGDDLEPEFTKYHLEHSLPFARFALILAVLLYALFGILDFFIVPDAARWIWLIRYAIFCPAALIVLGLTFTRWFKPVMQPILASVAALAGLGIVAMIATVRPSAGYLYYAGLLLVIPWAYTVLQLRFSYATRACLAIIIGYEIVAVWLEPTPIQILINSNFFFLSAVIIGMVAGYTIERGLRTDFLQRRLIEAQRAELAVHNAQLDSELQKSLDGLHRQAAELQASRARIVSAADGERRRIERNLHDGASSFLPPSPSSCASSRSWPNRTGTWPGTFSRRQTARSTTRPGICATLPTASTLRCLLRAGCRPPLRRRHAGRRCPPRWMPTPSAASGRGRGDGLLLLPGGDPERQQARGEGATLTLRLREDAGMLTFDVVDDGKGFDAQGRGLGAGFVNMADRLGALGGSLRVESAPQRGTTVSGAVPAKACADAG